jgi:Zn-dependent M28 family amino/carboxypeptidase
MRSVALARAITPTPDEQRPLPMILLARARAGSPFLPAGWPDDDRPQTLAGRRFSGRVDVRQEYFTGYNVVAIARGSDPTLDRSYVAFGAHYDHIGVLPPVGGDSIANGADDDASGSVGLLAVARALKAQPARRSALFVWHAAEEKGLLGSEYFTDHPTVPLDSIVAQINADMIGRNARDSLYVVGPAAAPRGQSAVLGRIVDSVNAALPRPFQFNREWDSPDHPERIYERSDHYNYARKGIPIVFFTSGLHPDYHGVDDEVGRIDFDKLRRVVGLLAAAGLAVGNRAERPR